MTASYSLDSYVFVEVTDTSGGLINWDYNSENWTELTSTEDDDGNITYVYYKLLETRNASDTEKNKTSDGYTYYLTSLEVLDGNSISYSSSIENDGNRISVDSTGTPTVNVSDYSLTFKAYIIQADITGDSSGSGDVESALVCWNALNASSDTSTVTAGNVKVSTETSTDDEGNTTSTTTTSEQIVVTSDNEAYTATVPAGVTIDTDTADIVTTKDDSGNETTTTTLILVVKEVGEDYSEGVDASVSTSAGESATVYDVSIIGVHNDNDVVMEIAMNIGTGLYNVEVEHEGADMTALSQRATTTYTDKTYYYDSTEGILYIYTSEFSEFAITYLAEEDIVARDSNGNVYGSLNTAVTSAASGATVTVLSDTTLTSAMTVRDKTLTLDLNGCTVTLESEKNYAVNLEQYANLTITDTSTGEQKGVLTKAASEAIGGIIYINGSGVTLTIDGGVSLTNCYYGIYTTTSASKKAISLTNCTIDVTHWSAGAALYMKKQSNSSTTSASNVTIGSGVTFTGYGQAIYNIDGTTTTVTVNGATFKKDSKISNSGRIYNSGTGTISIVSGTFEGLLNNNSTGSISITGGTFASNPSSYVDANNYTVTSNDDGTYTVTAKSLNEE